MDRGGWAQVGDVVKAPVGMGKVLRVSAMQKSAHVEVDGQTFEVPLGDMEIKARGGKAYDPNAEGGDFPDGEVKELKRGDFAAEAGSKLEAARMAAMAKLLKPDELFAKDFMGDWEYKEKKMKGKNKRMPAKKKPPIGKPAEEAKPAVPLSEALTALLGGVNQEVKDEIERSVDGELKTLRDAVKKNQKLEIKIGNKTSVLKGKRHKQLETLINYAALRLATLVVGMAGTGKTHAAEQTAEALKLPYYTMSVGAQTSKSDIIGYMSAGGEYVKTHFRDAYEKGGVFLMDEIDAGNANVLIQVNAALSNGLAAFPDAMVKMHKDFIFVASANTYGNGANRQYVGRNQLDAATLDRFTILDWEIDNDLEESLSSGTHAKSWYMAVRAARDFVQQHNIRALITPRATQKGSKLLEIGMNIEQVVHATMLGSVPVDKQREVEQVAVKVYNNAVPDDVPEENIELPAIAESDIPF